MKSSSRDIYFYTQRRNQTKLWPVEKYWLESFIMSVPSPFLINSFSSFLLITYQVFRYLPQVFLDVQLPSVNPKLNSAIGVDWIKVCLVSKHTDICLLISCLNTGFRIAILTKNVTEMWFQKNSIVDLQLRSWKKRRQQDYKAGRKKPEVRKNKTYFNKSSKWLKRMSRDQENVFLFEFGLFPGDFSYRRY